jgi:hypothetical protein
MAVVLTFLLKDTIVYIYIDRIIFIAVLFFILLQVKVKVHSRTDDEGPERD